MIIKNEIPILEYDDSSLEVITPNHGNEDLKLPEKCLFAFLGDVVHNYAKVDFRNAYRVFDNSKLAQIGLREFIKKSGNKYAVDFNGLLNL